MAYKYEYDLPFPDTYKKILLKVINLADSENSRTGRIFPDFKFDVFDVFIGSKKDSYKPTGNPFIYFDRLELIDIYDDGTNGSIVNFVILPKAFKWASYQKKNRIGRFFERNFSRFKDIMIGFSFLASLALSIYQIYKIIKGIP